MRGCNNANRNNNRNWKHLEIKIKCRRSFRSMHRPWQTLSAHTPESMMTEYWQYSVIIYSGVCASVVGKNIFDKAIAAMGLDGLEDSAHRQQNYRLGNYSDEQPSLFGLKIPFSVKYSHDAFGKSNGFDIPIDVLEGDFPLLLRLLSMSNHGMVLPPFLRCLALPFRVLLVSSSPFSPASARAALSRRFSLSLCSTGRAWSVFACVCGMVFPLPWAAGFVSLTSHMALSCYVSTDACGEIWGQIGCPTCLPLHGWLALGPSAGMGIPRGRQLACTSGL